MQRRELLELPARDDDEHDVDRQRDARDEREDEREDEDEHGDGVRGEAERGHDAEEREARGDGVQDEHEDERFLYYGGDARGDADGFCERWWYGVPESRPDADRRTFSGRARRVQRTAKDDLE